MTEKKRLLGCILLAAMLPATHVDEPTAEKTLTDQGLRKVNLYFVLPDESAIVKSLCELQPLRKKAITALAFPPFSPPSRPKATAAGFFSFGGSASRRNGVWNMPGYFRRVFLFA